MKSLFAKTHMPTMMTVELPLRECACSDN